MITASIKTTRKRIIGIICVILAFIIAVIMFFAESEPEKEEKPFSKADFLDFVESYGWDARDDTVSVKGVALPEKPDEIMQKYNELQRESGFDLEPFFGEEAEQYVCEITNFDGMEEIYASIYVKDGKIIAADISSYGERWQTSIDGKAEKRYY